jgi:enediyne biosynthesis protein E4
VGRYDASFGTFLENTGNDTIGTPIFKVTPGNKGLKVTGEVRSIQKTNNTLLFVRNSDAILRYKF